jgi:hypothetical protein
MWLAIDEDRRFLSLERYSAEPRDQWVPALACDAASKHVRNPHGVAILALCLAATFVTDERCFLAPERS